MAALHGVTPPMDDHPSYSTGGMDTSASPLDLSIRKTMDMLDVNPKSAPGFWTRGPFKGFGPLKEVKLENTKQPSVCKNGSRQEPGLYRDQTCLPLRKRKFLPSPKEETADVKRAHDYSEWERKYYSPPYVAVTLPPMSTYYPGELRGNDTLEVGRAELVILCKSSQIYNLLSQCAKDVHMTDSALLRLIICENLHRCALVENDALSIWLSPFT